jgi:hypothetical protein
MWEEGNVPLRAQRIILQHIKSFFGRCITLPERYLRELESGSLPPISDSVKVGRTQVHFWYKKIDEVVCHRVKTELKMRGQDFFTKKGYSSLDVVLGCDHGARRFRAQLRLIFRNSGDKQVEPYSITLCVGSIDCAKDTREVLEKTIGKYLNESLHVIINNKYVVAHTITSATNEDINVMTFAEEPPSIASNNSVHWFVTICFVANDLAFFGLALGKENSSTCWCTWCTLSKQQWAPHGHENGDSCGLFRK